MIEELEQLEQALLGEYRQAMTTNNPQVVAIIRGRLSNVRSRIENIKQKERDERLDQTICFNCLRSIKQVHRLHPVSMGLACDMCMHNAAEAWFQQTMQEGK